MKAGRSKKAKDIVPEPVEPGGVHPELGGQVDAQREGAVHRVVKESPAERDATRSVEDTSACSVARHRPPGPSSATVPGLEFSKVATSSTHYHYKNSVPFPPPPESCDLLGEELHGDPHASVHEALD